jgi:hypothetical protein
MKGTKAGKGRPKARKEWHKIKAGKKRYKGRQENVQRQARKCT